MTKVCRVVLEQHVAPHPGLAGHGAAYLAPRMKPERMAQARSIGGNCSNPLRGQAVKPGSDFSVLEAVRRLVLSVCTCLLIVMGGAQVMAQEMRPPPRTDTRSPTGVSFKDGSYSFEEQDLSIGGEFPNGITLTRSYNSSSDGYSYPFLAPGWTSSLNIYILVNSLPRYPQWDENSGLNYKIEECVYNVVGGPVSVGFYNTTDDPPPPLIPNVTYGCGGNIPGTYIPAKKSGARLEFIGPANTGYFRLTGSDGTIIKFITIGPIPRAEYQIAPDGTRLDYTYSGINLKSVFSSRGWAILIEGPGKVCAVNRAQTYVTPTSACPADAQTVTYTYGNGTYTPLRSLLTSATRDGATRTYQYGSNDHVNCIKDPGQTVCRIQTTYGACPEDGYLGPSPQPSLRLRDPVLSQIDASGKNYGYALSDNSCAYVYPYPTEPDWRPINPVTITLTETGVGGNVASSAITASTGQLKSITDPLGRTTSFTYDAPTYSYACCMTDPGELESVTFPEGNKISYVRDARGNVTSETVKAKLGSGLADLVTTAVYPATCSNALTCNKPTSKTDAKGNVYDYTYDPAHGGILTETGPAGANGIRPVKRFAYLQRTAWVKTSTGSYVAENPVWLLAAMKTCRTSATVSGACSAGSSDEVVTTYEYGPNSGPNNLLLRGMAVTADGQTLRTCYAYDANGRKISETKPAANLGVCP